MSAIIPLQLKPVMDELAHGMALEKCHQCGCMVQALTDAETAFTQAEDAATRVLLPSIQAYRGQMRPVAYDCLGCNVCFGAQATIAITERFDGIQAGACSTPAEAPVVRRADAAQQPWPPYPGDYVVGATGGSVAVCTLSSRDLAAAVTVQGVQAIAIAGRCDTENIGVEKVVLNLLANPQVRTLILCGSEAKGHRTGDAFLRLKAHGVDAGMRVLESASWRPVLTNLTLVDVARFRTQVEVVNLIGVTDIAVIVTAAQEAAAQPTPLLSAYTETGLSFERITARSPTRLKLDPAGFFIVLPNPETGRITCEHYLNNGQLVHVIEGRQAALIAATAVERGLVTRLDHAVYLGRELAKAELALQLGITYEQDAALGALPPAELHALRDSACGSSTGCGCH